MVRRPSIHAGKPCVSLEFIEKILYLASKKSPSQKRGLFYYECKGKHYFFAIRLRINHALPNPNNSMADGSGTVCSVLTIG